MCEEQKANEKKSESIINDFGVSQGFILGSFLLIIHIYDISDVLDKFEVVLYADDILIYTEGNTSQECKDNMVNDIITVNTWLKMN